jgi:hypothetical protein
MKINAREHREERRTQIANNQTQRHDICLSKFGFQIKHMSLLRCSKGSGLFQPCQLIPKIKRESFLFSQLNGKTEVSIKRSTSLGLGVLASL